MAGKRKIFESCVESSLGIQACSEIFWDLILSNITNTMFVKC